MAQRVPSPEEIKLLLAAKNEVAKEVSSEIVDPPTQAQFLANKVRLKSLEERRFEVSKALAADGIDPVQELLYAYNERYPADAEKAGEFVMSRSERVSLMKDLLQYVAPKLKAVETTKTVDKTLTIILQSQTGETLSMQDMEQRGKMLEVK